MGIGAGLSGDAVENLELRLFASATERLKLARRAVRCTSCFSVLAASSRLGTEGSDAAASLYGFQWDTHLPKKPDFDSANSLHGIRFWANNMTWCKDPASISPVQDYLDKAKNGA